jgi:hypothetical protein
MFLFCSHPATNISTPLVRRTKVAPSFPASSARRAACCGKDMIDRDWPHQVALRADYCAGRNYVTIRLFCEGLSLRPRGYTFRRDDIDMTVFCFADHAHADQFQNRFGGEFIDPKNRPKRPGSKRSATGARRHTACLECPSCGRDSLIPDRRDVPVCMARPSRPREVVAATQSNGWAFSHPFPPNYSPATPSHPR